MIIGFTWANIKFIWCINYKIVVLLNNVPTDSFWMKFGFGWENLFNNFMPFISDAFYFVFGLFVRGRRLRLFDMPLYISIELNGLISLSINIAIVYELYCKHMWNEHVHTNTNNIHHLELTCRILVSWTKKFGMFFSNFVNIYLKWNCKSMKRLQTAPRKIAEQSKVFSTKLLWCSKLC